MRLILAADFCYTFFEHMINRYVPDSAVPAAEAHRAFARAALLVAVQDPAPEAVAALVESAARCFEARGKICGECGVPNCLHPRTHRPDSLN